MLFKARVKRCDHTIARYGLHAIAAAEIAAMLAMDIYRKYSRILLLLNGKWQTQKAKEYSDDNLVYLVIYLSCPGSSG